MKLKIQKYMADSSAGTRQCPYCKEEIKNDAIKCKHCGSNITPSKPIHGGTCPYCKEQINPDAIKCKHCRTLLYSSLYSPELTVAIPGEMPDEYYRLMTVGLRREAQRSCWDILEEDVEACVNAHEDLSLRRECLRRAFRKYWNCELGPIFERQRMLA